VTHARSAQASHPRRNHGICILRVREHGPARRGENRDQSARHKRQEDAKLWQESSSGILTQTSNAHVANDPHFCVRPPRSQTCLCGALVLSGCNEQAGVSGRPRVRAGDVVTRHGRESRPAIPCCAEEFGSTARSGAALSSIPCLQRGPVAQLAR
jgi:hypothetical protein